VRIFRKSGGRNDFVLSMVGVRMGDRFLQIGCGDGRMFATLAAKVGLTGRAAAIDEAATAVERARKIVEREGVLADVSTGHYAQLPFDPESFDLVVLDDVLAARRPEQRVAAVREALRVLRPGGRCMVVEPAPRGGLAGLLGPGGADPRYRATGGAETALAAEGFRATRTLAEREGLVFAEGIKSAE
jgi:ubiquinone/menaquinone biosynthesis C-methylase UbiE